jgi:diguanylate cyclase (GGDEF)-like protein
LIQAGRPEEAALLSEQEGRPILDEMVLHARNIGKRAEGDINRNVRLFKDQSMRAFRITIALSVISLIFGFTLAVIITYNIARPLKKLEKATALIAEGKFNNDLNMNRGDSIGSLARAFIVMSDRLKVLETIHRDASPLTGLPGNLAIEKHLKDRLAAKKRFSLCHLDLDNFKPFADHYGYAWGSEVIKEMGQIIRQAVQNSDKAEVFVGHIGGDDFVLIAEPEQAEQICQCVLQEFDRRSLKFYAEEDREKGFFTGYDRSGNQRDFPLITMTIAIASDDGSRFQNPLEIAEMAAKSKEYAKSLPGSNYVKLEEIEHLLHKAGNSAQASG